MEEIRRSDNGAVFLNGGYITGDILDRKTKKDVGPNAPNYNGIHHFGFQVDDLDQACDKLNHMNGEQLNSRDGLNNAMGSGPANFEMKRAGPYPLVIEISHTSCATS